MNRDGFCGDIMYDALFEGYIRLRTIRDEQQQPVDFFIQAVNCRTEEIFNVSRSEIVGKTVSELLVGAEDNWYEIFQKIAHMEEPREFESFFEGSKSRFRFRYYSVSEDEIVLLVKELTLEGKAQEALLMYEILFDNAHDIILLLSPEDKILAANRRASMEYGYTRDELSSMSLQDICHPSAGHQEEPKKSEEDEGVMFETAHVRKDGTVFPVEVTSKAVTTKSGRMRVQIVRNITKRKLNEQRIAWLANYDALTRIPNRGHLMRHLVKEISRADRAKESLAVMLFDVDKFKHINDHYGHETGDEVLRHVARSAQKTLRKMDLIGRLGGDEFVVVQTMVADASSVERLAQRIQRAVNKPVVHRGKTITVTVSIGICLYPKDAKEHNRLLQMADEAMYQAKSAGGGTYCFYDADGVNCD